MLQKGGSASLAEKMGEGGENVPSPRISYTPHLSTCGTRRFPSGLRLWRRGRVWSGLVNYPPIRTLGRKGREGFLS